MDESCCVTHDGPHLHGCIRPRVSDQTHTGPCYLSRDDAEAATARVLLARVAAGEVRIVPVVA